MVMFQHLAYYLA